MPLTADQVKKIRNLTGFWLLGLCNNFAYVVMLSAAYDILDDGKQPAHNGTETNGTTVQPETANDSHKMVSNCHLIGTGAVLLADILPAVLVKVTAPLYIQLIPYWIRVCVVVFLSAISFPLVAVSRAVWLSLLGVACASVSSGVGEITFLSLSSHFDSDSISTWSSGTGAAGVFGALAYAGLVSAGLSPRDSLLVMLVVPATLLIVYFCLLVKPETMGRKKPADDNHDDQHETEYLVQENRAPDYKTWALEKKLKLVLPLLPYMVPLMAVYFAEYFINQGLHELVVFNNIWLSKETQYRWFQVTYQIGVLISRSSVNCVKIRKVWVLALLQMLNLALFFVQVFVNFIPNIWIIFAIILYEGLLGGAAYVNTFYMIATEIDEGHREYSMGVGSIADSFGIAIAGAMSIPIHNFICTLTV